MISYYSCAKKEVVKIITESKKQLDKIIDEMTQSDYEHLVETFDKYFGEFVILER